MASPEDRKQEQGIRARNQEFRRYEQVRKDQDYGLSEMPGEDAFDEEFRIRTCDLRLWFEGGNDGRQQFSTQLGQALERIGFAILTGHGVAPELHEQAARKIVEFFETTAPAERRRYLARRHGSVNQGYFPLEETTVIHPDLVEGWVFCRRAFRMDGQADFDESAFWPAPGFEPVFRRVCQAQEQLILPVMRSILTYLGCSPALYDRKLENTNFGFRLNYYPPATEEQRARGGGRLLGHEDVDLFTFLPAPLHEGLQVLNRANGKWIRLQAPPGSIILNTGDYMQRITNDRLPSTTHRVSQPREVPGRSEARVSFPMAVYVWEDELLEVLPGLGEPKYEPITAIRFHTAITSKYYGDDYAVGR
jgi:isopenicillin N synthase-like dioxygenase